MLAATALAASAQAPDFCKPDPKQSSGRTHPLLGKKESELKESERDTPSRWHSQFGQDRLVHKLLGSKSGSGETPPPSRG